jgi:hypothetical protein
VGWGGAEQECFENFAGKDAWAEITSDEAVWECPCCDSTPIKHLQHLHTSLLKVRHRRRPPSSR